MNRLRVALPIFRNFTNMETTKGPVETTITNKLQECLNPQHIDVINESYMHAVPKGSETHFKVVVISSQFEGLSLIQRHRLVIDTLKTELNGVIHALSIEAKAPQQWESSNKKIHQSPPCLGGSKQ